MLSLITLFALNTAAQKQFTLEDLNFGGNNYEKMSPQNRALTWWGDQLLRLSADTCWSVTNKGKETVLFTRAGLNNSAGFNKDDRKIESLKSARFPYADKSLVLLSNN